MMTNLIGWMFVLLNPITGGSFLAGMAIQLLYGGSWPTIGLVIGGVWILMFCLWFDGSKYQRNLV